MDIDPHASDAEMLRAFLAERDQPCPRCKYNLRRLQGQRCPECGEPLVLRVGLVKAKIALMITGLIGLSCGLGFSGLLLLYGVVIHIVRPFRGGPPAEFYVVSCGALIVLGGMLAVWLGLWRFIQRTPVGVRIVLVMVCWAASLVDLIVFAMLVN